MRLPIPDVDQLTPAVLTAILREKGALPCGEIMSTTKRLVPLETVPSVSTFLEVTYSSDAPADAPTRLLLKVSSEFWKQRPFGAKREPHFYTNIATAMSNPPVVRCYDAVYSQETAAYHLLLEDVSETHVMQEHGPGIEWPTESERRKAELIIDSYAQIHGHCWNRLELALPEEIPDQQWIGHEFRKTEVDLAAFFDVAGEQLSVAQQRAFERVIEAAPNLFATRLKGKTNLTILHRDTNFGNILIPRNVETGRVYIIDWDTFGVGFGPHDLASHITRFWSPDVRQVLERDLLRRYYNRLLEHGIENYDWDDCWDDYRLGTVERLYNRVHHSGSEWAAWMRRNVLSAFEDLRCEDLL